MKSPLHSRYSRTAYFHLLVVCSLLAISVCPTDAAAPTVSNFRSSQRPGTQLVDIDYDLADTDSATLTVSVGVSTNGGASYTLPASSFTGAVGNSVAPGANKRITWNARVDWPNKFSANVRFRITASDDTAPSAMSLIPAGWFQMGDNLDGDSSALPVHSVYVSAFYMDRYEVTKALWDEVYQWATNHGYSFGVRGFGDAATHPAVLIHWYGVVKWCNARSEKEERVPAYYTSASQTTVYRTGQINLENDWVKWNAGYRLPTEAEWEKAARGGASGHRFPWTDADVITHSRANYYSTTNYAYDVSPTRGDHPMFPYTSPAGYFAANGYGLYDMAGNVWEWCWDWYGAYSSSSQTDPRGPTSVWARGIRGGGCNSFNVLGCRSADRYFGDPPQPYGNAGFRSVLPPGQ